MIPNVIHQIWLGNKQIPKWTKDWNSKLWREKDIEQFELVNKDKYEYFLSKQEYAGASDIARVEILYRLGGVYMDTDSQKLEDIDELLDNEFFAGYEYDRRIANGVIGSIPKHPILKDYIERITEATIIEPPCYTIGGTLLTSCVESYKGKVLILPQEAFYPKLRKWKTYTNKVYARHMFANTRGLYE